MPKIETVDVVGLSGLAFALVFANIGAIFQYKKPEITEVLLYAALVSGVLSFSLLGVNRLRTIASKNK